MYRQYENPYSIENRLRELENIRRTVSAERRDDIDFEIEELKARISLAWDDDENGR